VIKPSTLFIACALLLACGDDEQTLPTPTPTPVDASTPAAPAPDASTPVESKAIPLVLWVDDLLDHHTNDTSAPDTVDDKKIDDDEDPSHFINRF
jgi:hypothetical protein